MRARILIPLVLAAASCGGGSEATERRVLVVGWDGATFDLIDPMVEAGRLPHLARLIEGGATARLESTRIPISSAAWPTIATGVGPGVHGVYDFLRPSEGSWDARLVSARDVDAPPLWRILSRRGHRVHVFGVPITFPPEPVDGTLVAGMLSPLDADYAWPPGTADALRARGFVPDVGLWRRDEAMDLKAVRAQVDLKRDVLVELLADRDWSLAFIAFKSLDVLCHRPDLALNGEEVAAHMEALDRALGDLVEAAGEDATVVVLSDHGFARYPQVFNVHRWLIDEGFSRPRPDAALERPRGAPNLGVARATARSERLAGLDLARTRALAEVAEGPFGAIRVPRAGREPGATATAAEAEATLQEIERALRAATTPSGEPLVLDLWRGADLYPGPHADLVVPDLVLRTNDRYRCVTDALAPALAPSPIAFPDHALDGILVVGGARARRAAERGRAALVDVAPTLLHALGEPIPSSMRGDVRVDLLAIDAAPVRVDAAGDPSLVPTREAFEDVPLEAQSAEVVSRIGEIGYGR